MQNIQKHARFCSLLPLQAPSISSRGTPTGSLCFQAPHRRADTHDPWLQTGWTALTPPHPQPMWTTSPWLCLHLQENRSSGSDGGRLESRRKQEEGGGSMGGTDMEIHKKTDKTKVHTSGLSASAKMEHWLRVHYLSLLPCCWAHGYLWQFKVSPHNISQLPSQQEGLE